jgi:hypothetical protein
VTVFYDPRRPGAAVLGRGGFGAGAWAQLLGRALLLGGLGAWFVRRGRARPTARPVPAPLARPA